MPKVKLNVNAGEYFRLEDLLYSLMLESHNDSAVVIAEHIAGSVEASFFDTLVDTIVVFLRKTIYKDSPQPQELLEGNALTYRLGCFANRIVWVLNKTAWRERPDEKDYTHQYALAYTSFKENTSLIGRSLSYGLILFCVGLLATLVYLLLVLAG